MGVGLKSDSGKIELAAYNYAVSTITGIVDKIGCGTRSTIDNPASSVYFNAPIVILDNGALSKTTMRIEIYVKDIAGSKNITKITQIRDALIPLFEKGVLISDAYFMAFVSDITGSDGNGFHYCFLNLSVTII